MIKINSIRGMNDILGTQYKKQEIVKKVFFKLIKMFNYKPVETPIMEYSEVFNRTLGKDSDVVNKEMYTFKDNSSDSLTLRPEGTASIARAIISNSLTQNIPLKFYYSGPMFRYERPQKGRFRQFHQLGIEIIGNGGLYQDCESIVIASKYLDKINALKSLDLRINTLGNLSSRKNYINALSNFLESNKNKLSSQSKVRLNSNPLRILDSKEKQDIDLCKKAPIIYDFLSEDEINYFDNIKKILHSRKIKYKQDPFLVRGLDYYNQTTFEFTYKNNNKFAVLAGGRYDNLVKELGGPSLAGVGWASGIERLIDFVELSKDKEITVALIPLDKEYYSYAFSIVDILVESQIRSEILNFFNLKKSLKYCNKIKASFAVIFGENEIKNSIVSVKNLKNGKQVSISKNKIKEYFINE